MRSQVTGIAFSTYSLPVHPFGSPITTILRLVALRTPANRG